MADQKITNHRIYALGSNGSGQLGLGHTEDVSVPRDVANLDIGGTTSNNLVIRAGGNHSLLLLPNGRLLSSGDASTGARGLAPSGGFRDAAVQPVKYFDTQPEVGLDVVLAAATWEASIVVAQGQNSASSNVYTFGTGNKGELGQGELIFRSPKASLLNDFPPSGKHVIDISASVGHVVALLDDGEVWGWGNGRKGQLGEPPEMVCKPRRITGVDFRVLRAVCGREFTVLLEDSSSGGRRCALLGANKWNIQLPPQLPPWKDVAAGWGNVFILKVDGSLLSYGRNDHGQLPPTDLPALKSLAVGSEHAIGLTAGNQVIAWGWGEHGNCGPKATDGDVKGYGNVLASSEYLPEGHKIVSVGCGCATSWIHLASEACLEADAGR